MEKVRNIFIDQKTLDDFKEFDREFLNRTLWGIDVPNLENPSKSTIKLAEEEMQRIKIESERYADEFQKIIKDEFVRCAVAVARNATFEKTGVQLIADERKRQMDKEGYTLDHDQENEDGCLADASALCAKKIQKSNMKQINVNFKPLHPNCHLPAKATELAAGWDVTCTEIEQSNEDFVICKLGFALTPPSNYRIVLVPRSSLTKTHWVLQNSPGTGDPDYTGEYQYRFRAIPTGIEDGRLTYEPFPYKVGERIGQIYLQKIIDIKFEIKINLNETTRGAGGFGSTGTQAHTNI